MFAITFVVLVLVLVRHLHGSSSELSVLKVYLRVGTARKTALQDLDPVIERGYRGYQAFSMTCLGQ
jgi:hypothetical protein